MKEMPAEDPATPCGLVAKSLFTDSYSGFTVKGEATGIDIKEDKIAWATDKEFKFKNVESY